MAVLLVLALEHGVLVPEILLELEGRHCLLIDIPPQFLHEVRKGEGDNSLPAILPIQDLFGEVSIDEVLHHFLGVADTLDTGVQIATVSQVFQALPSTVGFLNDLLFKWTVVQVLEEIKLPQFVRDLDLFIEQDCSLPIEFPLNLATSIEYIEGQFLILLYS